MFKKILNFFLNLKEKLKKKLKKKKLKKNWIDWWYWNEKVNWVIDDARRLPQVYSERRRTGQLLLRSEDWTQRVFHEQRPLQSVLLPAQFDQTPRKRQQNSVKQSSKFNQIQLENNHN